MQYKHVGYDVTREKILSNIDMFFVASRILDAGHAERFDPLL